MDLSLATSIYERAIAVKNNKSAAEAEHVSNDYTAFQIENPNLPNVASFCALDYLGNKIELLDTQGEETINSIIKALEPYVRDPKGAEFYSTEILEDIGLLKGPFTIKIPRNQETVRQIETQVAKKKHTQKLSQFLDTILKQANFRETEWLEFKRYNSIPDRDILGKIFAGLSNTAFLCKVAYAYLIIGINESKKEICGTKVRTDSKNWELFERELRLSFKPGLEFEVDEFDYKNNPQKHTIIFTIHAANEGFISYCNKDNKKIVYIRKGDLTIPLDEGSNNFPQNSISAFSQSTDSPNYDKNSEMAHSVNQQPKTVINNIQFIIANPQFENCGNEYKNFQNNINNVNSHNSVKDSPNTNIGSNNKDDHSINTNTKKNFSIWTKIVGLATILALPFSGFALRFCDNNKPVETIVSSSSTDALKYSSEAIHANHPTDSVKVILSDTINHLKKDTLLLVRKDTVIVIQKDTTINNLKNISLINEACVLYHDAKSIYPDGVHIAGDVESLANSFNKFAKKIKNDKIELCSKFDDGLGTLTECGRKILKTVKRELEIYIRNNKINCNQ